MVVLWGWVTVRGVGGHVFTAPRGTVVETDGRVPLQLAAEPVTTHVVVVALQWGGERPQPSRDTGLSGEVNRHCGPPSCQGERNGTSREHFPGFRNAETPLGRRPRCEVPWKVCMERVMSPGHGITFWWPHTTRQS